MILTVRTVRLAAFVSFLIGFAGVGIAQNTLPLFTPHPGGAIEKGTRQMSAPFAGGLSAPQFAQADLNGDSLLDLVIFNSEYTALKVRTFINSGTAGSPRYTYAPRFQVAFSPNTKGFLKLIDYNCDGIPDLFHNGDQNDPYVSKVNVSRGYYNAAGELRFSFYKHLYYSQTDSTSNVFVGNTNEPGIADVDGDGDIDIVSYNSTGEKMYYYRNYRAERGLSCDSIQLELESQCWGRVGQGIDRTLYTGLYSNCGTIAPPFWDPNFPDGGPAQSPLNAAKTTAHGYNTVCLLDIDGDGDIDVLNSNAVFADIQLQLNSKAGSGRNLDSIVVQDTLWQTGGKRVKLSIYPTAYHLDMDADGRKDIVVSPHQESGSKDYNQVWWYRNVGTNAVPSFQFQKDSLICEDMIDGGSNSHPLYYDFNKDGKPDILLGSTRVESTGSRQNQLAYYQNVTTSAGNPKYKFVTDNLVNGAALPQFGMAPAVGDLDGDGKDDLLIGLENGQFAFYKNSAASNTVPPVWTLTQVPFKNPNGSVLDAGDFAAPFIYDINKDGLPDILAGNQAGRVTAFINTNITQGIPIFGMRKDSLGGPGVVVDVFNTFNRVSTPYVGRIDSSSEVYLIMGSNSGLLYAWRGLGTGNLNAGYTLASSDFSSLKVPTRSAPALGDGDGDGKLEMLVGSSWGGLFMYGSDGTVGIAQLETAATEAPVSVFPNPATTHFVVRREAGGDVPLQLTLCNLIGQVVAQAFLPAGQSQTQIETAQLPAGLYVLTVQGKEQQHTLRVALLR